MSSDVAPEPAMWRLVAIEISREVEDTASAKLFELGTNGIITLEERAGRVKLGAYFSDEYDAELITREVEAEFIRTGLRQALFSITTSTVPEQDWMQKWKEGFEPVEIGSRLVVAPSWKLPVEANRRVIIQIDPGMAFGTGAHETTRMCLELIEERWRGGRLLDVGTGSGILAIAAALITPGSKVVAIDVDPQAVRIARENVLINQATSSVEVVEGSLSDFAGVAFDMVVANLTADLIIELAGKLAGCVSASGTLLVSGILTPLAREVEKAISAAGLALTEFREAGEWTALVARRRDS